MSRRSPEIVARDRRIVDAVRAGARQIDVARDHGLTKARVGQIWRSARLDPGMPAPSGPGNGWQRAARAATRRLAATIARVHGK